MIQATLEDLTVGEITTMDCKFKYDPYELPKRMNSIDTCAGIFVEKSANLRDVGPDAYINFTIDFANAALFNEILQLYRSEDSFIFTGFYGDSYEVEFEVLNYKQRGGWWKITGKLLVRCVITEVDPLANCS